MSQKHKNGGQTSKGLFCIRKKQVSPPLPPNRPPALNQQMINSHFKFEGVMKNGSICFQKLLKFDCLFDLDGQDQGHQFRIHLRHL